MVEGAARVVVVAVTPMQEHALEYRIEPEHAEAKAGIELGAMVVGVACAVTARSIRVIVAVNLIVVVTISV